MTPTEADYFLSGWSIGEEKGVKYVFSLYGPEYLVITRREVDLFKTLKDRSSIAYGDVNESTMRKYLTNGTFVIISDNAYMANYKFHKSNGCECGAWATRDPDCHASWCRKSGR